MDGPITALKFDFTKDNLATFESTTAYMTSGENILKEILQFENDKLIESPFVQFIKIACDGPYNQVKDEQMSAILEIDESNLLNYKFFTRLTKNSQSYTTKATAFMPENFTLLADKQMLQKSIPIFEIRFKMNEKWSPWQAIAGKFILAQNYKYGLGGIAEVYSPITKREGEVLKQNFQVRFSGSALSEVMMPNALPRIHNDPYCSDIRKVIDPNTFQILFDSQILNEVSQDESFEIWQKFARRYRS